jgi:TP901 family phage tail tape measure protein
MARTAEVIFLGDAASLIRASEQAAAATQAATAKIEGTNARLGASSEAAAARTAKAHDKMAASAAKTNEAFGKWGTVTAVAVAAGTVDMALKFEHAAGRIAASSGTSVAAAKRIETAFQSTAGEAIFSADQIGESFAKIAGELGTVEGHALNSSQAMKVMSAAMNLAEASGGELNATTEALGKVMLVFHLGAAKAAEASDILFTASKKTGTSVEETSLAVEKIRGRLGVLAPSLKETGGLMDDFAKHGIRGRESLAALNGTFNTLIGGSKKTEEMLKTLGVHVFDSSGKFVGLKEVIAQLGPALSKYDQQGQLAATRALFGASANKKLLDIIHEGPAAFEAATKAVSQHGAASEAAKRHSETFAGQLEKLKTLAKDLGGSLGALLIPALSKLAGALEDGVKWLKAHHDAAKALGIVISTVLGAAMLDFAVTKAIKFADSLKSMGTGLKWLAGQFTATTAVVVAEDGTMVTTTQAASLTMKRALLAIPFAAVAFAAYELATHWKDASKKIEEAAQSMANFLIDQLNEAIKGVNEFANKISFGLIPAIEKLHHLQGAGEGEEATGLNPNREPIGGRGKAGAPSASNTQGGIMAWFEAKGLSKQQAAGILGNFEQESSTFAGLNSPEGIGLASWHDPGRVAKLKEFAKSQHKSWEDVGVQLAFTWQEMVSKGVLGSLKSAKSPEQAAEIFNKMFEGGADPQGKREAYARKIFGAHPQSERAMEEQTAGAGGTAYGPKELTEAGKAKKAKKGAKAPDLSSQIDSWAEHSVGKFAESWGKNTGPELDKLQAEFHTHAAAWCSEFATTAAMFGGASKEVRTASVASIREWAQAGSHGYKKGVSHTPHVGDMMMFGDSHVGFVSAVHGSQVTTIEGNTGAGKVSVGHRNVSEGDFASPIYHNLKTGKVLLEKESKAFGEAVKQAEKLLLSSGQRAALHSYVEAAGHNRAEVQMYAGYATQASEAWEKAKPGQEKKRKPLFSAEGAHEQLLIDEQDVMTAKARKLYYEREVKALAKEAKDWGKIRDSYLKFARHAHGKAKIDAINKAAAYEGKVKTAQDEAKALGGSIQSAEEQIAEGEVVP